MANVAYLMTYGSLFLNKKARDKRGHLAASENVALIVNLAKNNPKNNYYVIGKVDLKNVDEDYLNTIFPNKNVFFTVEEKFKIKSNLGFYGREYNEEAYKTLNEMVEYFKEIKIDYGIAIAPFKKAALPGISRKGTTPEEFTYCMADSVIASCYSLYLVNNLNFPWVTTSHDIRHLISTSKSLINPEKCVISTNKNDITTLKLYKDLSYKSVKNKEIIEYKVPIIYGEFETLSMFGEYFSNVDRREINIENKNNMILFANPSSEYNRLSVLEEYIINEDYCIDVNIYGKWFKNNPELEKHSCFKGEKSQNETYDELIKSKYTFIIPSHELDDGKTNCSVKFWESIFFKVIPFMHKNYGSKWWKEHHNIPEFLWIKDKEDLKSKIEFLENNEEEYKNILNQLEEILNGKTFDNIENILKENIIKYCGVDYE